MDEYRANKRNVERLDKRSEQRKEIKNTFTCKFCKSRYVHGDLVCGLCYYKHLRGKNVEIWKLREQVAKLKIKLRNKK